jgi:signal transduction histidine kinase
MQRPGRRKLMRFAWATLATLPAPALTATRAGAAGDPLAILLSDLNQMGEPHVVGLSLIIGLVIFATILSLLHLAARRSWTDRERGLATEIDNLRAALDRASVFLAAEPQITIVWGAASGDPDIDGDINLVIEAPVPRRVLGFGAWLDPAAAQTLDASVSRLRERGEGFRMSLVSLGGRHLEADGRAVSGRAVLRIRDISGDRMELLALRRRHAELGADANALRRLLDTIGDPAWIRDDFGKLTWVNAAYAGGVEARDAGDVLQRQVELLDRDQRDAAARAVVGGTSYVARVPALVAGARHLVDVAVVAVPSGSVGVARDRREIEALRDDLERRMESHARTLDLLTTAVATFDGRKRLIFHNAAYRHLWSLDQAFLEQGPTDGEILDRLRAARRLPEEADFRSWRTQLHATYQSFEPTTHSWYLPGGRSLRVVVNPDSQGGVTYLFDDVSERVQIESQFNAMLRVQRETLDTLREGVAVFGTDARLKLHNPAFAGIGRIDPMVLASLPRFDLVAPAFAPKVLPHEGWHALRNAVMGHREARTGVSCRIERADGTALECVAAPLPDGDMLITFADVTPQVNFERALTESNQALVEAANLRNNFVHHVSYELRSPLTAIIGFIQMLADGTVGPLNPRQHQYVGYVRQSSNALLAIINDILDLATIDRDALDLQVDDVDIRATMAAAAEGIADRLTESRIDLKIVTLDDIGTFRADPRRLRQILFNLLSNAIGFSEPGQRVTLAALRRDDDIVFKVTDQGRGIPPDVLDKVFDRFQSHTVGSRHRGVGLGLSLVRSLVELHGGRVLIDSAPGEGTVVTCIFPVPPAAAQASGDKRLAQ